MARTVKEIGKGAGRGIINAASFLGAGGAYGSQLGGRILEGFFGDGSPEAAKKRLIHEQLSLLKERKERENLSDAEVDLEIQRLAKIIDGQIGDNPPVYADNTAKYRPFMMDDVADPDPKNESYYNLFRKGLTPDMLKADTEGMSDLQQGMVAGGEFFGSMAVPFLGFGAQAVKTGVKLAAAGSPLPVALSGVMEKRPPEQETDQDYRHRLNFWSGAGFLGGATGLGLGQGFAKRVNLNKEQVLNTMQEGKGLTDDLYGVGTEKAAMQVSDALTHANKRGLLDVGQLPKALQYPAESVQSTLKQIAKSTDESRRIYMAGTSRGANEIQSGIGKLKPKPREIPSVKSQETNLSTAHKAVQDVMESLRNIRKGKSIALSNRIKQIEEAAEGVTIRVDDLVSKEPEYLNILRTSTDEFARKNPDMQSIIARLKNIINKDQGPDELAGIAEDIKKLIRAAPGSKTEFDPAYAAVRREKKSGEEMLALLKNNPQWEDVSAGTRGFEDIVERLVAKRPITGKQAMEIIKRLNYASRILKRSQRPEEWLINRQKEAFHQRIGQAFNDSGLAIDDVPLNEAYRQWSADYKVFADKWMNDEVIDRMSAAASSWRSGKDYELYKKLISDGSVIDKVIYSRFFRDTLADNPPALLGLNRMFAEAAASKISPEVGGGKEAYKNYVAFINKNAELLGDTRNGLRAAVDARVGKLVFDDANIAETVRSGLMDPEKGKVLKEMANKSKEHAAALGARIRLEIASDTDTYFPRILDEANADNLRKTLGKGYYDDVHSLAVLKRGMDELIDPLKPPDVLDFAGKILGDQNVKSSYHMFRFLMEKVGISSLRPTTIFSDMKMAFAIRTVSPKTMVFGKYVPVLMGNKSGRELIRRFFATGAQNEEMAAQAAKVLKGKIDAGEELARAMRLTAQTQWANDQEDLARKIEKRKELAAQNRQVEQMMQVWEQGQTP